jgi:histidyl-tRNA synthetase
MADRPDFRAPKGTQDVLPPESARWEALLVTFAQVASRFGYGLIQSPMFEDIGVFQRIGEGTDVVAKEMYDFDDKGGRHVALRPEGTAPVARAYVEHRPPVPWKVWYATPAFRYEQPQAGRLRQHHQVGVECIGSADPDVDVEVIALAHGFYADLGLADVRLSVNSMGAPADRAVYVDVLRGYLLAHADGLGPEFTERATQHPMRVLDSKSEAWQDVIERAPQLTEYLGDEARAHFERVQEGLEALGIAHELDPRLVRGFDYYTSTTFEFASGALDAAQNAVGGGGRYDQLAEEMAGPPTPGIGFGIGIERVLLACDAEGAVTGSGPVLDAFVVDTLGDTTATTLVAALRESGLRADRAYGGRSMKAQMKLADRSGAAYAVVVAPAEAERGCVAVKGMLRGGEQIEVPLEQVAGWLRERSEEHRA